MSTQYRSSKSTGVTFGPSFGEELREDVDEEEGELECTDGVNGVKVEASQAGIGTFDGDARVEAPVSARKPFEILLRKYHRAPSNPSAHSVPPAMAAACVAAAGGCWPAAATSPARTGVTSLLE
jgi:hypothetical protein